MGRKMVDGEDSFEGEDGSTHIQLNTPADGVGDNSHIVEVVIPPVDDK